MVPDVQQDTEKHEEKAIFTIRHCFAKTERKKPLEREEKPSYTGAIPLVRIIEVLS